MERALREFASAGRVPRFVHEACIFRRSYFISQFLPALTSYAGPVAGQMELLAELGKKGLVPTAGQQGVKRSK